jgi:hypothetical protein
MLFVYSNTIQAQQISTVSHTIPHSQPNQSEKSVSQIRPDQISPIRSVSHIRPDRSARFVRMIGQSCQTTSVRNITQIKSVRSYEMSELDLITSFSQIRLGRSVSLIRSVSQQILRNLLRILACIAVAMQRSLDERFYHTRFWATAR